MTDFVDSATRSRWMAGIRGKDTVPELLVRRFLHSFGLRYRLHVRLLPGSPDIVLPAFQACIFIHGCFWHRHAGCRYARNPSTRPEFWAKKFETNVHRDAMAVRDLTALGWRSIGIWECGLKRDAPDALMWLLNEIVKGKKSATEWPRLTT